MTTTSHYETRVETGAMARRWHPCAVMFVCKSHHDGESWTRYLVLDRAKINRRLMAMRHKGLPRWRMWDAATVEGFYSYYRGPGRGFARDPYRKRLAAKRFIVIVQHGGLDI